LTSASVTPAAVGITVSSSAQSTSESSSPNQNTHIERRKGMTLNEYVRNWFKNTRFLIDQKIAFLSEDFQVNDEDASIKCLKCSPAFVIKNNVQLTTDSWKPSNFSSHLQKYHKITSEQEEQPSFAKNMDPILNTSLSTAISPHLVAAAASNSCANSAIAPPSFLYPERHSSTRSRLSYAAQLDLLSVFEEY
jgi:hypothetical protein